MSKKEQVSFPGDSRSLHQKRFLLDVSIHDLMDHFSSSNNELANEVISEALAFAKSSGGNWKFWLCFDCNEKFIDSQVYFQHVERTHLKRRLSPKHCSLLPLRVDSAWESMILHGTWKPIDTSAALTILEDQMKSLQCGPIGAFNIRSSEAEKANPATDKSDLNERLQLSLKELEACSEEEFTPNTDNGDLKSRLDHVSKEYEAWSKKEFDRVGKKYYKKLREEVDRQRRRAREYFLEQIWPLSDDLERAEMLSSIRNMLEVLLLNNSLTESHRNKIISYCMKELGCLLPTLVMQSFYWDQTHMCICFLGAFQLQKVVKFLQEISQFAVKPTYDDENDIVKICNTITLGFVCKEEIVLNGDSLSIFLDDNLSNGQLESENRNCNGNSKDRGPSDDTFLRWSLTCMSSEDQLKLWKQLGKERMDHGKELFRALGKNNEILWNMLEKNCDMLSYNDALEYIWLEYVNDLWQRMFDPYVPQNFETILQKLQTEKEREVLQIEKEIACSSRNGDDALLSRALCILKAISNVLEETRSERHDETLLGFTTGIFDVKLFGEGNSLLRIPGDDYIEEAVKRLGVNNELELIKNDAWVMQTLTKTRNLEHKIIAFAADDYSAVMLPLVKSYIQANMEWLASKDARKKSGGAKRVALAQSNSDKTSVGNEQFLLQKQIGEPIFCEKVAEDLGACR